MGSQQWRAPARGCLESRWQGTVVHGVEMMSQKTGRQSLRRPVPHHHHPRDPFSPARPPHPVGSTPSCTVARGHEIAHQEPIGGAIPHSKLHSPHGPESPQAACLFVSQGVMRTPWSVLWLCLAVGARAGPGRRAGETTLPVRGASLAQLGFLGVCIIHDGGHQHAPGGWEVEPTVLMEVPSVWGTWRYCIPL